MGVRRIGGSDVAAGLAIRIPGARAREPAARIAQVSQPPPPSSLARDLDQARVGAARVQAELAELRAERDDLKRQLGGVKVEAEGLRASAVALQAAVAVRDTRADDAAAASRAALERAVAAEQEAAAARVEQERRTKSEEEARALALGAQERFGDIRAQLDLASSEIAGLRKDFASRTGELASLRKQLTAAQQAEARVRGETEAERTQARARESQMIAEVRERETKLVQEVREREAQLVAAAQGREAQLAAAGQARETQLGEDLRDASDQIGALTQMQAAARERESKLQQALNAELEEQQEKQGRSGAHAGELQSVVDSLGRERTALRSEAGAMRAKVEMLSAAEERSRRLGQELEELRGENEFLNQELARANSPRGSSPPPLPKAPGA